MEVFNFGLHSKGNWALWINWYGLSGQAQVHREGLCLHLRDGWLFQSVLKFILSEPKWLKRFQNVFWISSTNMGLKNYSYWPWQIICQLSKSIVGFLSFWSHQWKIHHGIQNKIILLMNILDQPWLVWEARDSQKLLCALPPTNHWLCGKT